MSHHTTTAPVPASPALTPREINRIHQRYCEARFASLDDEQLRLHRRLASVTGCLRNLLDSIGEALEDNWSRFLLDGRPERAIGGEMRGYLRKLRRRCDDVLIDINNHPSAVLTYIDGETYGWAGYLPFADPEAAAEGEGDADHGPRVIGGADVLDLPDAARDLFAACAWSNVVVGLDMLSGYLDQALDLPAPAYAGQATADDFGPADLLEHFRALRVACDLHRSALECDAPPAVTRRCAAADLEPLSNYLSAELAALGVDVWDQGPARVTGTAEDALALAVVSGDPLDGQATLVVPVDLDDADDADDLDAVHVSLLCS